MDMDNTIEATITPNNTDIIQIANPNLPDINKLINNIINDNQDNDQNIGIDQLISDTKINTILPAVDVPTLPIKSPLFKRKIINTSNTNDINEQKKKHIEKLPIYHSKFNDLIKSYTTDKTTINTHKKIVDDILELYIKNGQHKVSEYTVSTLYSTDTYSKTLLQYSIDCATNINNSKDILFYHDKIRDLICCIAFLSNIGLILGEGTSSEYLSKNGWPPIICKLVDNVFPIMAYHSSKGNIKCIQDIIDKIDNIDKIDKIDNLEYKELSFVINKCMQNKVCNTRKAETECYLYEYIRPKLINVLQSF